MRIISIKVGPNFEARLRKLREFVGVDNNPEVIREALRLYEFMVKKHLEGRTFRECWISAGDELSLPLELFAEVPKVAAGEAP